MSKLLEDVEALSTHGRWGENELSRKVVLLDDVLALIRRHTSVGDEVVRVCPDCDIADCKHIRQRKAEQATGWRDLSTAPRDGKWILVRQEGVLEPSVTVCSFDPDWSEDGWWMCCDGKNPEIPLRGPEPSWWMPIAPLPAREGVEP